jgi:hypothetical protein
VIRNTIFGLVAEDTACSSLAKLNMIASFITPDFLVNLHVILHNGKNAGWICAKHGFVAETDMAQVRTELFGLSQRRQTNLGRAKNKARSR